MATPPSKSRKARLKPDEELALVRAAAGGDRAARARLVDAFMPLIGSVACDYSASPAVHRDELMQEGVAGLLTALRRYDPDLGTPFWAYASWWVRQAMQRLVAELSRPAVLSDRALRQLARVRDARRRLNRTGNQEPSVGDLVTATRLSRERVEGLLAVERPARGLDERAGGDETSNATYGERLPDPISQDGYDRVVEGCEAGLLARLTEDLPARERGIVEARYGFDRPACTLREIAEVLNLSIERVRQIEEGALGKLRTALEVDAAS
jgi:RNA polymerase primary sigma factor